MSEEGDESRKFLQVFEVLSNGDVHIRVWPLSDEEFDHLAMMGNPKWEMITPADQVTDVANYAEERAVVMRTDGEEDG